VAGRPRRPAEAGICRDQWDVERFREGDVRGVVDREVLAQLPAPGQQGQVRCASEREIGQIGQSQTRAPAVKRPDGQLLAQYRDDLQIDEFRSSK
jgi:hypothetical protein